MGVAIDTLPRSEEPFHNANRQRPVAASLDIQLLQESCSEATVLRSHQTVEQLNTRYRLQESLGLLLRAQRSRR